MSSALPANVVSFNGVGVVSDSQLNANVQGSQNVNQLRSFVGLSGMSVMIQGTAAPGDGGVGLFYWNPGNYTDDGVNVIVPYAAAGQGAWLRSIPTSSGSTSIIVSDGSTEVMNVGTINFVGAVVSGTSVVATITVPSASTITPAQFLALDLSTMPTSDPGGGRCWLNGNVVSIGTVTP